MVVNKIDASQIMYVRINVQKNSMTVSFCQEGTCEILEPTLASKLNLT